MSDSSPCGRLGRREFLAGVSTLPAITGGIAAMHMTTQAARGAAESRLADSLGNPGPYPGRVVEVRNPAMIKNDVKNREAIRASVARGMTALTGSDNAVGAWRRFFEPGDVVGVKMNPVGNPLANSSNELMLEVIDGLKAAGVKPKDIVVFERYRDEFIGAKMHEAVPDGVDWGGLGSRYNTQQLDIKGADGLTKNYDRMSGYDPDEFVVMEMVGHDQDPKDERTRRSHLGLLVTRRVNKIVLLPVLKDHASRSRT